MVLRMARPVKRPTSSFIQFRRRIPRDVLPLARGRTIAVPVDGELVALTIGPKAVELNLSLRTRDPGEAKARQGAVLAHLEGVWKGLRDGPKPLTNKQVYALAGEVYRAWTEACEDDPGAAETWRRVKAENASARAGRLAPLVIGEDARRLASLEARFGRFADVTLGRHALTVDDDSRARLLLAVADAMDAAAVRLTANAGGDYSPDAYQARFPKVEAKPATPPPPPSGLTLTGMLAGWWEEGQKRNLSFSTYDSYAATVAKLRAFLGHDGAGRITPDDVLAFKDHRLQAVNPRTGKPVSPTTVKNNDLAGLKAVFAWAVGNRKLPANPAAGITVRAAKQVKTRSKGFTEAEAQSILAAARRYDNPNEGRQMVGAKRWIPWLMAYTGGRVGEFVQLRREDVRQEGGIWFVDITPTAGPVKDKEARRIALHPHLVEMGFVAFVQAAPAGRLFLRPSPGEDFPRGQWRGVKNRLRDFGREFVKDAAVRPNHGWRHRFKTVGRQAGIDSALLDAITGHAPRTVGDSYGDFPLNAQHHALSRMPRYPET